MEKPTLIFQKMTEKGTNKIRIPKTIVESWGRKYFMEIYADKIILKPIKKGE